MLFVSRSKKTDDYDNNNENESKLYPGKVSSLYSYKAISRSFYDTLILDSYSDTKCLLDK